MSRQLFNVGDTICRNYDFTRYLYKVTRVEWEDSQSQRVYYFRENDVRITGRDWNSDLILVLSHRKFLPTSYGLEFVVYV